MKFRGRGSRNYQLGF